MVLLESNMGGWHGGCWSLVGREWAWTRGCVFGERKTETERERESRVVFLLEREWMNENERKCERPGGSSLRLERKRLTRKFYLNLCKSLSFYLSVFFFFCQNPSVFIPVPAFFVLVFHLPVPAFSPLFCSPAPLFFFESPPPLVVVQAALLPLCPFLFFLLIFSRPKICPFSFCPCPAI